MRRVYVVIHDTNEKKTNVAALLVAMHGLPFLHYILFFFLCCRSEVMNRLPKSNQIQLSL